MHDEPRTELEQRALDAWTPAEPPPGFAGRVVAAAGRRADPGDLPRLGLRWPKLAVAAVAAAALAGTVAAGVRLWSSAPPATPDAPTVVDTREPGDAVGLPGSPTTARAGELDVPADLGARIDRHLAAHGARYGEAFKFQGSVVVVRAGELLYQGHFGASDRAAGTRIDERTRFKLGSLTQQFTAVAVLQLRDEGRLGLDDPLQKHLPDFPHRGVTVRHLLSHTSGVPSYTDDLHFGGLEPGRRYSTQQVRAVFEGHALEFAPGTDFDPSNSGYFLLGALVERLTARPFADVLRERVLLPAGMTESSLGAGPGDVVATGYEFSEDEVLVPPAAYDLSVYGGAAGMVSTPADMVRWDRALATPNLLLSPASLDEMYTVVRGAYGLGWALQREGGQTVARHPGGVEGFNAAIVRYLGDRLTVLALANTEAVDCREVIEAVAALARGEAVEPPHEHEEVAVSPAMFSRYLGEFTLTPESRRELARTLDPESLDLMREVKIYDDQGRLFMLIPMHGAKWLHALGDDRFFFKDLAGTTAEFGPPGAPVTSLVLRQQGLEFRLGRRPPGAPAPGLEIAVHPGGPRPRP